MSNEQLLHIAERNLKKAEKSISAQLQQTRSDGNRTTEFNRQH